MRCTLPCCLLQECTSATAAQDCTTECTSGCTSGVCAVKAKGGPCKATAANVCDGASAKDASCVVSVILGCWVQRGMHNVAAAT